MKHFHKVYNRFVFNTKETIIVVKLFPSSES